MSPNLTQVTLQFTATHKYQLNAKPPRRTAREINPSKMKTTSFLRISAGFSALASQFTISSGVDVEGRVAWNAVLPDISHLPTDSKVLLRSSNSYEEFIRQDGTFILQNVNPGRYVLTVQCRTVAFPALSIQVTSSSGSGLGSESSPIVQPYVYGQAPPPPPESGLPTRPLPRLQYPVQLIPTAKLEYEEIKVGFNPIAMLLGNPMYLLMAGLVIFMMIMPKILALMDPEALVEARANQANLHKQMSSIQNMDFASGLSKVLSGSGEEGTEPSKNSEQVSPKSALSKSNTSTHSKRRK